MKYQSSRFGEFEANQGNILTFTAGLSGFEDEIDFALMPFDPNIDCPLMWLHSLNNPDLAFVITDPNLYMADYQVDLTAEEKRDVALGPNDIRKVYVIVRIPEEYRQMTGNFLAPIVVNETRMICKQFVLTNPQYETRHFLLSEEVRTASS